MAHTIRIDERHPFDWWAACTCGWTPDLRRKYRTKQMVEDEISKHTRLVERARLHLRRGTGNIKTERDYYQKMADDENVSAIDRRLWQQLADGLNSRLGKPGTEHVQEELFPRETVERKKP